MNIDEIKQYKDAYELYYGGLRTQQGVDQEYYDDEFKTHIKKPYHEIRTGSAAKLVDSIVQHINTENPQATREPRNKSQTEVARAVKVSRLLNHWLVLLIDEIEEAVKNNTLRGEAFFQVEYNTGWDKSDPNSLPIRITAPDPMIVYADPVEIDGIPRRVLKFHEMPVGDVQIAFPNWSNPQTKDINAKVNFLAYYDNDWRYLEADGEALLKKEGQKNLLGITPFTHCYSGFGKRSYDGKPENHAVGRLRKIRGRLVQECDTESRVDSTIGLYANPVIVLKPEREGVEVPEEGSIDLSPGAVVVLPPGWDYEIRQGDVPTPQMFQHLYQIRAALGEEIPPIMQGVASGSRTSGRLEDILGEHVRTKYARLVHNVEKALAKALGMGLKLLEEANVLPIPIGLVGEGKSAKKEELLSKEDIDGYYACSVELRAPDELAEDRKMMLYRLLANENRIDWKTLLTDGMGWTQEKADDVINQTIADSFIFSDPTIRGMIVREAIEKMGMTRYLKEIEADKSRQQEIQEGLKETSFGGQARPSEARNPMAADITRQVLDQTPLGIRRGRGM